MSVRVTHRIGARYAPVSVLGKGGASEVLLVEDQFRKGRSLSLKRLPSSLDRAVIQEFQQLSSVSHPGIPEAYELGFDLQSDSWFFTYEFVEGANFLEALAAVPFEDQIGAIAQLLRTLQFIHERGVIHRDLKPANVLVRQTEGQCHVWLMDFGLATDGVSPEGVAGSLPYLAPEVLDGAPSSAQSDLYSLGIMLFELWYGKHPFNAETALQWVRAHKEGEVVIPGDGVLPASFARLVQRLLVKDPGARYPSPNAVLTDLSRLSVNPLSREDADSLRGKIRSLPVQRTKAVNTAPTDGGIAWIVADNRRTQRRLSRALRAELVSGRKCPLFVSLEDSRPLERLAEQVSSLPGERGFDDASADACEDLFEALQRLPLILCIESWDQRNPEHDPIVRRLLRLPCPIVVESAVEPNQDPLAKEFVEDLTKSVQVVRAKPITLAELKEIFPEWLGFHLPDELSSYLVDGESVEVDRLVEILTYLFDSKALTLVNDVLHVNLDGVDLKTADLGLSSILARRVGLLKPEQQSVLLACAIMERGADEVTLAQMLQRPALDAVCSALRELGFLRSIARDRTRVWVVAGAASCEAVLSASGADAVRDMHRRAAAALKQLPQIDPQEVTLHEFHGDPNSETGERLLDNVQRLFDNGKFAQALRLSYLVRRQLKQVDPAWSRASLLVGRGLLRLGSLEEAIPILEAAAAAAAEAVVRDQIYLELSGALERLGRIDDAFAVLNKANEDNPAIAGSVHSQRAFLFHRLRNDEEALKACQFAARQLPETSLRERIRVHNTLGLVLQRMDDIEGAREQLVISHDLCERAGNRVWQAVAKHNLGRLELECGQIDKALKLFRQAKGWVERYGDRPVSVMVASTMTQALLECGMLDDAKVELQRSREELESVGLGPRFQRPLTTVQAQCALLEGEVEAAFAQIEFGDRLAQQSDDQRGVVVADLLRLMAWTHVADTGAGNALTAKLERRFAGDTKDETYEDFFISRLNFLSWLGSTEQVSRALDEESPKPSSRKRLADLSVASARAGLRLGRHDWVNRLVSTAIRELEHTELADRVALLHAFRIGTAAAFSDAEVNGVRRSVDQLVMPGHRLRRAEALLRLGIATSDVHLIRQSGEVARTLRHLPLEREAQVALERFEDSGAPAENLEQLQRLESLEQLKEVTKAITREIDGERLLRLVLDNAVERTGAKRGFLILLRGDSISIPVARNMESTDIENPEFSVSSSVARSVALDGNPYLASDASVDDRFRDASSISQLKLQSILCVPLRSRDQVIGAVYLDHPTRVDCFDSRDLMYVEDLSDHAAIALEKSALLKDNLDRQRQLEKAKREVERLNRELQKTIEVQEQELTVVKESLAVTQARLSLKYSYPIVTRSEKMRAVLALIDRITDSSYPVYVFGESGTGKELIARSIHNNGPRSKGPYFSVNCATVSPTLIETELFGHVKGSFTGADRDKPGFFELTNGGTLFLDEISDASLDLQAKLLRAVQFGEVIRVGSDAVRQVDVRVISASNRDLSQEVEQTRFRQDLFYRLNVHRVEIPPLRDRREDIPLLIAHFQEKHAGKGLHALRLHADATDALLSYDWPGNVRELENCIIDLMVRCSDLEEVTAEQLSLRIRAGGSAARDGLDSKPLKRQLEEFEARVIQDALGRHGGIRSKAAKTLGMSERNLYKKLSKYGFLPTDSAES